MLTPPLVFAPIPRLRTFKVGAAIAALFVAAGPAWASPWAGNWVSYNPGATPVFGFTNPATALGSPERFTGENEFGGAFQSAVTMFNPVFGSDEAVSIGEGGHLTLQLDTPATNAGGHLYGVDLIVFGNASFASETFPDAQNYSPASIFGNGNGRIELSSDGVNYFAVPGWVADSLFPTQGYHDVGAFSDMPGSSPTNFLRPVNPSLTLSDFNGLTYAQSMALYDGSGGGTPIDIALAGLTSVTHIRFSVDNDFNPSTSLAAEIDAVAAVPEPAALTMLLIAGLPLMIRNSRKS